MRKIGYCRVSSSHQNLDRQIGALRAEGVDAVYREKASGKSVNKRPELEKSIDQLGTGDVLILSEWDRCTRCRRKFGGNHRRRNLRLVETAKTGG